MNRPEAELERHVLLALGQIPDLCIWRNEVGVSHPARIRPLLADALSRYPSALHIVNRILDRNRITHGLGKGSPDLIGCVAGWFVGLELKSEDGRLSDEQRRWRDGAERAQPLIETVRTVEEAIEAIRRVRHGALRTRETA